VVTACAPLLQADVSTPHDSAVPPALLASGAGFIGGLSANCDLVDAVCVARSGCLHLTFDLGTVSSKKADAIMRRAGPRCLTLAKIMRERVLLNDLSERSRTVKGAMDLMLKYNSCRHVAFEVLWKFGIVAVTAFAGRRETESVAAVAGLCMASASVLAVTQPYADMRSNSLWTAVYLTLGFMAVLSAVGSTILFRMTYVAPMLVATYQLRNLESDTATADRICKALTTAKPLEGVAWQAPDVQRLEAWLSVPNRVKKMRRAMVAMIRRRQQQPAASRGSAGSVELFEAYFEVERPAVYFEVERPADAGPRRSSSE